MRVLSSLWSAAARRRFLSFWTRRIAQKQKKAASSRPTPKETGRRRGIDGALQVAGEGHRDEGQPTLTPRELISTTASRTGHTACTQALAAALCKSPGTLPTDRLSWAPGGLLHTLRAGKSCTERGRHA